MRTSVIVEHRYEPRGGCKATFESRHDEVLVSGPAGTGKSRACLEKLHAMCLLTPGLRAAIVRKTAASLGSTALVTYRKYVALEAIANGTVAFYGGSRQEAAQYRYTNGSSITIGGMDNPSRIMSSEYDIIYVQEATELFLEDLEALITRLRNWRISFQQLLMDCNPAGDKHPLKLRCNSGQTHLIESRHEDNPVLFDDNGQLTEKGKVYITKLDSLTGVRKQRLRYGKWVSAEGVIYEEFDPAIHVLQWDYDEDGNKLPLPEDWARYWTIDFGLVHPFVCQFWAVDHDGNAYLYREVYMTGRIIEDHCKTILDAVTKTETIKWYDHLNKVERSKEERVWIEPKPRRIVCDHDAQARRTFERHTGLGTVPAIKWINDGIDLTKARLVPHKLTGEPRLFFMEDTLVERDQELADNLLPTCTVEEITGYIWAKSPDGRTKAVPVDRDDHGCDSMRYFVMDQDFKGKARVSFTN